MMDSADPVTEPAGDSRPIRFEELLEHEKELIHRVNGLLRGIKIQNDEDNETKRIRSSLPKGDPWAIVEHNRRHRVIMISGPRGSGKTSLMLTLLAGWRAAWTERPEDWDAIVTREKRNNARDVFALAASVVRPLKPLDFDPLPPDLPLHGWIVEAFRPLVQWLMNGQAGSRDGFDPDRESVSQSRTSLPWSDSRESLLERLRELYEMAVVGWGSDRLRTASQKDLSDFVLDQEQQHRNWQQLQERWHSFLDNLFKELDRRTDVFPKYGLLVLPIDDADLQIERDRELILALRLLYHPRLVYLLTGDIDNLKHALMLEFLRRMMQSGLSRDTDLENTSKEKANILSNSISRKVFPSSHVLKIGKLTISQILEWNKKTSNIALEKIKMNYNSIQCKGNNTLYHFLEKRSKAADFDFSCLLFRDLQQFQDQYIETVDSSVKSLADFLKMFRSEEEDPDEFTVIYRRDPIVLHTYPGSIVPVARIAHQSLASLPSIEVRVGVNLEFYQERIAGELSGGKKARFLQASPLTLLALDLAAASPHVHVHQHTPKIRPSQCMAWSIFSGSSDMWLPWPSIESNSPTQLAERGESWAEAVSKLDATQGVAWVDHIAFTWVRLHLLWMGARPDQLPAALPSNTGMEKAWSDLVACFISISGSLPSQWYRTGLPLLIAPEYGLSKDARTRLLDGLLGLGKPIPRDWHFSRCQAVLDAKKFEPGQSPRDWLELFTAEQERDERDRYVIEREGLIELFKEIVSADQDADSPWVDWEKVVLPYIDNAIKRPA